MVITNYLLTGMTLQVAPFFSHMEILTSSDSKSRSIMAQLCSMGIASKAATAFGCRNSKEAPSGGAPWIHGFLLLALSWQPLGKTLPKVKLLMAYM